MILSPESDQWEGFEMPFQRGGDGEKDWLEGCVPWDGKEKYLLTGALTPPKVRIERLMKSWDVLRGDEVK